MAGDFEEVAHAVSNGHSKTSLAFDNLRHYVDYDAMMIRLHCLQTYNMCYRDRPRHHFYSLHRRNYGEVLVLHRDEPLDACDDDGDVVDDLEARIPPKLVA